MKKIRQHNREQQQRETQYPNKISKIASSQAKQLYWLEITPQKWTLLLYRSKIKTPNCSGEINSI